MSVHGRNSSGLLHTQTFVVAIIAAEIITLAITIGPQSLTLWQVNAQ
ncbi:MAG: hypothetical protein F2820_06425 [Actinobacteria bacterium]|nr:hypothetical protein [Actinomycetota bacterium]